MKELPIFMGSGRDSYSESTAMEISKAKVWDQGARNPVPDSLSTGASGHPSSHHIGLPIRPSGLPHYGRIYQMELRSQVLP